MGDQSASYGLLIETQPRFWRVCRSQLSCQVAVLRVLVVSHFLLMVLDYNE